MPARIVRAHSSPPSPLQIQAWNIANQSYSKPDGETYRACALTLYHEDLEMRILALFTRLDTQNAEIDAALFPEHRARAVPPQPPAESPTMARTPASLCQFPTQ